jgi:hypothetical protein
VARDADDLDPALRALVDRCRHELEHRFRSVADVRKVFEAGAGDAAKAQQDRAWAAVMRRPAPAELLAVHPVSRPGGTGQISLFQGDVFGLDADQWFGSSFRSVVDPSGGAWVGFWRAAARNGNAWADVGPPPMRSVDPDGQLHLLDVNPADRDGLPTLVMAGRFGRRHRQGEAQGSDDWPEWVYFDALRVCRQLQREGRLGTRIAMPVLFSTLHGVPYTRAIALQRRFALDLLRQEETVREVMISVLTPRAATALLEAWHLAAEDGPVTVASDIPAWVTAALDALEGDIRTMLGTEDDPALAEGVRSVLRRMRDERIYLNDIAVLARNVVEEWAQRHSVTAGLKSTANLASMVGHLRGRTGTPNRSLLYVDAIRELGNVGAHHRRAPHPLAAEDLVAILMGLKAMLAVERELGG